MIKTLPVAVLCALTLHISPAAFAGAMGSTTVGIESSAEREIARRQEAMVRAQQLMDAGEKAMAEKDYETAVSNYRGAVDQLPESDVTHDLREEAVEGFTDACLKLAEQRIAEGRYQDAKNLCELVLKPEYNPKSRRAVVLMARLEDPEYYNQTITPGFVAKVEETKKFLLEAQGFYDTGRYDMAMKRYDQVLNIDPYNVAARKGQEKINQTKINYGDTAYNEARSRAIWQLTKAWESPVRRYNLKDGGSITQDRVDIRGTAVIEKKLALIIVPKIDLKEATVREAIDYLKQKSRELDTTEADPSKRGVNIVLKLESSGGAPAAPAAALPTEPAIPGLPDATVPAADTTVSSGSIINPSDVRITLALAGVPLGEVLKYVASQAGLKVKIDPYAVNIVPLTEQTDVLLTKEYKVPPGFIGSSPSAAAATGGATLAGGGGGGANDASRGGAGVARRQQAREYLEAQGVTFPTGSSANFIPSNSKLIVRNTQENLDLIDAIVDAANTGVPTQVEIESKFVEISQNNLKELGFDWTLGQFNVPGSNRVFSGGGTDGTAIPTNAADFTFQQNGSPVGQQPVTAGNRSGNIAISANAIDALLFGLTGATSKAPSILGVAGVFTDPQFQVVVRALNQKKGVDLLSAPRVTTKSGQRAVIEIIREFRYPTEFDPPQIPQDFGSIGTTTLGLGQSQASSSFPVTPTTPTSFETRNTGVTLEVEPVVGSDGQTIDLNLVPQVVEFEGFINYGSPIQTSSVNALGVSQTNVLTPNVINQPIFSTRKVTTSVSVWDGQTVVLGGLMREDVQKVQDKTPLLGDIPLLGRLFRSDVDQHIKRNLIIFVTARLINPAGEPIQLGDEAEEVVEPLPLPEGIQPPSLPEAPLFSK